MNHLSSNLERGVAIGNSSTNYCDMLYNQQPPLPATTLALDQATDQQRQQLESAGELKSWINTTNQQQQPHTEGILPINNDCGGSMPMNVYTQQQPQQPVNHTHVYEQDQHYNNHQLTTTVSSAAQLPDNSSYLYYSVEPHQHQHPQSHQHQHHHHQQQQQPHQHQLMNDTTTTYRIYPNEHQPHHHHQADGVTLQNQPNHYQVPSATVYSSAGAPHHHHQHHNHQPQQQQRPFVATAGHQHHHHHEIQYMPTNHTTHSPTNQAQQMHLTPTTATTSPAQHQHQQTTHSTHHQQLHHHPHNPQYVQMNHHQQHHHQQLQTQYYNPSQPIHAVGANQASSLAHHQLQMNHPGGHHNQQQQHQQQQAYAHPQQHMVQNNHMSAFDNMTIHQQQQQQQPMNNFVPAIDTNYQLPQVRPALPQTIPTSSTLTDYALSTNNGIGIGGASVAAATSEAVGTGVNDYHDLSASEVLEMKQQLYCNSNDMDLLPTIKQQEEQQQQQQQRNFALVEQQQQQQQQERQLSQRGVVARKTIAGADITTAGVVLRPTPVTTTTAVAGSYDTTLPTPIVGQQQQQQQQFISAGSTMCHDINSRPIARVNGTRNETRPTLVASASLQTSPALQHNSSSSSSSSPYPQLIARSKSDLDFTDLGSLSAQRVSAPTSYAAAAAATTNNTTNTTNYGNGIAMTTTTTTTTTQGSAVDSATYNRVPVHQFQSTLATTTANINTNRATLNTKTNILDQANKNNTNTSDNTSPTVTTHHYTHPHHHPRSIAPHVPATSAAVISYVKQPREQDFVDMRPNNTNAMSQDWLDTISRHLIEHMEMFGICVIDNFLGSLKGDHILKEVRALFLSGQYTRGKLVNNKSTTAGSTTCDAGENGVNSTTNDTTGIIRNDRVIWIDGCEEGCEEINNLIQKLCSVITNSSRLSLYTNSGLDKIVINKRTKAHVACYPGNGTKYIKHVDNPNGDGRVITSIYYLNKDWNTKRHGGLLRMFPAGTNEVANIEPLFDRALFFWSDRRNPHEVLPAYKDRFAITVWYIGENRST